MSSDLPPLPLEYFTAHASARGLPPYSEANETELVFIESMAPAARGVIRLLLPAAAAWYAMRDAAAADRITLLPLSGFRSIARQTEIIGAKLDRGVPLAEILRVNAAPGYSEHHTGRALDLGTPGSPPLEESFGETPAFDWLTRRAGEFRFTLSYPRNNPHGIIFEPWHWCWH